MNTNNQNNPQEVPQVKSISPELLKIVFNFIKGITASIVYEDSYDYSKGVKGAEVDYLPEKMEELASELGVIVSDDAARIAELEKQNAAYRHALEGINACSDNVPLRAIRPTVEQALNSKEG